MRIFSTILIIAILSFLIQCKSKTAVGTPVPDIRFEIPQQDLGTSDVVEYEAANSIYGIWCYNSTSLFYNCRIKINKDGTFQYFDQSCLGKRFTEGNWTSIGFNQIFTSAKKYKKQNDLDSDTTHLFFDNKAMRFVNGFLYDVDERGDVVNTAYFFQINDYR